MSQSDFSGTLDEVSAGVSTETMPPNSDIATELRQQVVSRSSSQQSNSGLSSNTKAGTARQRQLGRNAILKCTLCRKDKKGCILGQQNAQGVREPCKRCVDSDLSECIYEGDANRKFRRRKPIWRRDGLVSPDEIRGKTQTHAGRSGPMAYTTERLLLPRPSASSTTEHTSTLYTCHKCACEFTQDMANTRSASLAAPVDTPHELPYRQYTCFGSPKFEEAKESKDSVEEAAAITQQNWRHMRLWTEDIITNPNAVKTERTVMGTDEARTERSHSNQSDDQRESWEHLISLITRTKTHLEHLKPFLLNLSAISTNLGTDKGKSIVDEHNELVEALSSVQEISKRDSGSGNRNGGDN